MRNSYVKINKNDILFNGFSNSEIGIYVRYKTICDNLETDTLTWQQVCFNFDRKERKVVSKLFGILPEVSPKFDEVEPKLNQSLPEVSPEKINKNKYLTYARVYNIPDKTRPDEPNKTKQNIDSGKPPKSNYVFEGEVIKLNQKNFDEWQKAYPDLNLYAELMIRDKWLSEQPPEDTARKNWFISTSQYFVKRNEYRKAQNKGFEETQEESFEEYLERSV